MADPKKEKHKAKEVSVEEAPVTLVVEAPKQDVKVFSLRQGKIILKGGRELNFRKTLLVTKEEADWLLDSFKDLIEIV